MERNFTNEALKVSLPFQSMVPVIRHSFILFLYTSYNTVFVKKCRPFRF